MANAAPDVIASVVQITKSINFLAIIYIVKTLSYSDKHKIHIKFAFEKNTDIMEFVSGRSSVW